MNFKNQLKSLTALLMVLGCMFLFNSCEDPIEDPCLLRDCGTGTCVEDANALDGYFCNCDDGFVNNASDGRCTECADGFYGENCDSTEPCDDPNFSCPTGASCVSDTTTNATSCVCDVIDAVLSADSTACVCPEGTELSADSISCVASDARLKFLGNYSQTDIECIGDATFPDIATVNVLLNNNDDEIILSGFGGISGGHDVVAVVNGSNFSIPTQELVNAAQDTVTFSMADPNTVGSFTIQDNGDKQLNVNYVLSSATADTCTAILTEL